MGILTLIVAIGISAVAAWYSIIGLMAIFSAAAIPIAIMGGVLEVGKLVTASWLYQNWKRVPKLLKGYLTTAVIVLMFITSMGIFGFLSKAHIDQAILTGDNSIKIETIDNRIKRDRGVLEDAEKVIAQLDAQVQTLINYDRIRGPSGSIAVRKSQDAERRALRGIIDQAADGISNLRNKRSVLESEQLKLEAEVGPIRYVAEFIYGEKADRAMLESAVRWVIIIIIFVFDPLAILLLIAANMTLGDNSKRRKAAATRKRSYNNKRETTKEVIERNVYPMEDGNATQVKNDPFIEDSQVWEDLNVVVKPKEPTPDMPAVGEEYDVQSYKDGDDSGKVNIKKSR
jgi:hypothetical protein